MDFMDCVNFREEQKGEEFECHACAPKVILPKWASKNYKRSCQVDAFMAIMTSQAEKNKTFTW